MRLLLTCSLVALLFACALAAPGSYCSSTDLEAYQALIKGEFKAGEFGGLKNNLEAVEALTLLGAPIKETSKLCDSAKNALEGDLSSVVMGLKVRAALQCSSTKIPDATMAKIEEALSKTEEPVTQISALSAVSVLAGKGIDKTKIDEAVTDLLERLSNDGFKVHEDMENGSGYLTGLLLEALASLKAVLSKEVKSSVINAAVDSVKTYLSSGAVQDESTLAYPHHDASVNEYTSTAILLDGLIKFNKAYEKKLGFNDEKVNKLARLFLSRVHITTINDAHSVLLGLHSIHKGTWRKPLIITATPTALKASAKGDEALVRFQITDIFGAAASTLPKLFLVALSSSDSAAPLITNQELTSADGANFEFNLLAIKPAPGNYKLTLSLTPAKVGEGAQPYAAIKATTRFVKVISSIEVSDLSLSVRKSKDSDESSATKHTFVYEKKAADIELRDTDFLDFSFSIKSKTSNKAVTVQQAFILLSQGDDESELFFVAKYDNVKKVYSLQVPLARHIARFGAGGQFQLRLLIGDSYIDNSIAWDVCKLNVKLTEGSGERIAKAKADGQSLKSSPIHKDFAHVASYKPEIIHQFRAADKRAEGFIARTFTAITLAPLGLFLFGLLFVGLNFGACPDGLGIIFALAFHACIIANAYIIVLFFLQNNLFETLQLLCYSVPPTIFIGHRALKAIAAKRSQLLANANAPASQNK